MTTQPSGHRAGSAGDPRTWWRDWLGVDHHYRADASHQLSEVAGGDDPQMVERRLDLEVEPGETLRCVLRHPRTGTGDPLPAVLVPCYDVAGKTAVHAADLADRGLVTLAVPWWFEVVAGNRPGDRSLADHYAGAVARHRASSPVTGLGRSVAHLMAAVDAVATLPFVDRARLGVFGHSLGGKLAMHLAALDGRIAAGVASEPGVGLAHSNWPDPWYLDGRTPGDAARDHDQLLSLVAPRQFLVIAGGDSDGDHNVAFVERARQHNPGTTDWLHWLRHDAGHTPPAPVLETGYRWLTSRLH